jgi:8-oxo-dGTP pyrophosphatase MutT (NUDIX family)
MHPILVRISFLCFYLAGSSVDKIIHISKNMSNNSNNSDKNASSSSNPRIDQTTTVATTKWIKLQTIDYTDQDNKARKWDVATRTTKQSTDRADAVVIVPLLKDYQLGTVDTLIVEQFRPPVGTATLEFPAGLIDKDESPEAAALRELREETGYVGERCKVVPQVSRQVCMSPGMTDETVHIVVVDVDLNNPYNKGTPNQELDEGEHVIVKRVGLREGLKKVLEGESGMPIEGLYLFSVGLELGLELGENKMR